jgi:4-hydroxybutyrate CoA-transferase
MGWSADYKTKLGTSEDAVGVIRSGDHVYYSGNAAIPRQLVNALAKRHGELEGVELIHVLLLGNDPLSTPDMARSFRHNSLFVGPADREAINDGRGDYTPVFLFHIPRLFRERIIPLDVAMVQVSPPDGHGFMSLGVETLASKAAVDEARTVIVQVNEHMPRVLGDCFVHVDQVDHIVEGGEALPTLDPKPPTQVEKDIAKHVLGLVEDGATLQMGIGGIPNSVYSSLDGFKDLGVHTEMMSDGCMTAIERGVITGRSKSLHPRKVVITFALGSADLYAYLDNNPMIEAGPVDYVNDPRVASLNDKLTAINSALEVDFTGQVCSDSIGTTIYSGFGGQVDFIRAAARSRGGKPIIAIPSTAKGGTMSRIVPLLKPGAGVVTNRADVHWVVTEYGAVNLFGKTLRERVELLISIAHPDFRGNLETEARARKLYS